MTEKRCVCNCGWKGKSTDMIHCNVVRQDTGEWVNEITACPTCFTDDDITLACDEPGCWKETVCGFPVPGGYRRTCREHAKGLRP